MAETTPPLKTITRKSMLYKTGVEYGDYTINHVLGCSHGCKFPCYAYLMKKRFGQVKSYEDWCEPKLVSNTLELLDKEIPKLRDKIKSVHLCFSTDPFMWGYLDVKEMSLEAIKKLNKAGIKCTTLTKGLLPDELGVEQEGFSKENEHGITLVSLDEEFRKQYEPNSAPYTDRINALAGLHKDGCKTWVSIEPYPTPNIIEQDLGKILDSVKFVDKIVFGKLNYNPTVTKFGDCNKFYNDCAKQVRDFCASHDIEWHIKEGTQTK